MMHSRISYTKSEEIADRKSSHGKGDRKDKDAPDSSVGKIVTLSQTDKK
jgi:hypothetical protein